MYQTSISITQVENGWIVEFPQEDQFSKSLTATMKKVKDLSSDPMLSLSEDDLEDESIPKSKGIHIFKTFEEVLSFLKFHISK